jgi:S-formylglutathione hydrolase FrmB
MTRAVILLRAVLVAVLGISLWTAAAAKADPQVEYLQVPSAAMGRDIPVAFQAGGPHAVYLLDAFNAGPDVSNWVTAGNAMNTLGGKGVSVVAPASGAFSLYTNWEQDGSKQWETFLTSELPDWLAANKGLAPGGHAIVGAALTCSDPAAMIGYCDQAQGSNRSFYTQYRSDGGVNGHFDFPTGGQHDWGSWAAQLGAMSGDIAAAIR